ncbi:MAG: hypothetical protein KBE04_01775, partial [Phycisphaerae bacterium]|nr:hypothetical protein [Phycisphaerae bacterium]
MRKGIWCCASIVCGCALQMAQAATVDRLLLVHFDGGLSGSSYTPGPGEVLQGTLRLKGGGETLSQGILSARGGLEGIRFLPAVSLTGKNAQGEDILNAGFVIEIVARRTAAAQGFQTLLAVHGSVAYRYRSDSSSVTQFMTYGPQSTGWRTVSGAGVPVSDAERVHYALVYTYGSPSQCTLSCYVQGGQVGSSLTNTTAAEGQPTWGVMFGGDS